MDTPDTEWDENIQHAYDSILFNHNPIEADKQFGKMLESVLNNLLSSRDTYWKERVRKEVEVTQKVVKDLLPIMWNDDIEKHASNIRLTNNLHIISKALDTLLDNLK